MAARSGDEAGADAIPGLVHPYADQIAGIALLGQALAAARELGLVDTARHVAALRRRRRPGGAPAG